MRLCAASRPVSILPFSSSVSPGFQLATSARVSVSRLTRLEAPPAVQVTFGHCSSDGGSSTAGPLPSRTKCAWRVAAQFGIIATGFDAACVGNSLSLTSSTVVSPPRPCAPIPSALTFS